MADNSGFSHEEAASGRSTHKTMKEVQYFHESWQTQTRPISRSILGSTLKITTQFQERGTDIDDQPKEAQDRLKRKKLDPNILDLDLNLSLRITPPNNNNNDEFDEKGCLEARGVELDSGLSLSLASSSPIISSSKLRKHARSTMASSTILDLTL